MRANLMRRGRILPRALRLILWGNRRLSGALSDLTADFAFYHSSRPVDVFDLRYVSPSMESGGRADKQVEKSAARGFPVRYFYLGAGKFYTSSSVIGDVLYTIRKYRTL